MKLAAVLLLHTLSWTSACCIVEVTDRFSQRYVDQFLFQDYKTCARARDSIATKYSDRRYTVTHCESNVWLPWESQGPTQRIVP